MVRGQIRELHVGAGLVEIPQLSMRSVECGRTDDMPLAVDDVVLVCLRPSFLDIVPATGAPDDADLPEVEFVSYHGGRWDITLGGRSAASVRIYSEAVTPPLVGDRVEVKAVKPGWIIQKCERHE